MREYSKSAADVINLLNPPPTAAAKSPSSTTSTGRAKRKLKIYKNPNTGEVVETRGGNQKTLKAWKDEHGAGRGARGRLAHGGLRPGGAG